MLQPMRMVVSKEGLLLVPGPGDDEETLRHRHVTMVPWPGVWLLWCARPWLESIARSVRIVHVVSWN